MLAGASVVLTVLTTYLLLDRNHAEEIGGSARIALDVARGGQVLPLVLVLALAGVAVGARSTRRATVCTRADRH